MRTFYHGSDDQIEILNANSYITPDISTAKEYGKLIYAVDVDPDCDIIEEIYGRRCITGFHRGTCSSPSRHPEFGFYESTTHVALSVTRVNRSAAGNLS